MDPMMKIPNELGPLPAPLNLKGRFASKKGSYAPRLDANATSLLNEKYAPYNGSGTERHHAQKSITDARSKSTFNERHNSIEK